MKGDMMNNAKIALDQLERIYDVRQIWEDEEEDFTPWLAENLDLLNKTLGLNLELQACEQYIGSFRADIVAKDSKTDQYVLIENQLGCTDHKHLGQIITYSAGLKAVTIIWIASLFTEEHKQALEWLNEHANGSVTFFGLEIELWRIHGYVAPSFAVICKPNKYLQSRHVTENQYRSSRQPKMSNEKLTPTLEEKLTKKSKRLHKKVCIEDEIISYLAKCAEPKTSRDIRL